jgi:uncharacterized membrane protein
MAARRINKHNAMTVISATILIGTELVAAAAAGGWALSNLMGLGAYGMYALQAIFMIAALYGILAFFRSATRAEPVTEAA